jgi:prepilin-type N-terminal cleavage/methylation domain-containing protein
MPMRRGFTFVEVLTVIAILALLAGVVFAMSAAPREKGRESACSNNLHQIYLGLELYSADYPGPEQLPGLGDIRLLPNVPAILQYVPSHDVFYCPNSTAKMRKRAWSTYEINFQLLGPSSNPKINMYLAQWEAELQSLGTATPLVICNVHDETYYAPLEQDLDPDLVRPFQLHLRLDGGVTAGRFPGRRHRQFTLYFWRSICYESTH